MKFFCMLIVAGVALAAASPGRAQIPSGCEDRLRETRILAEHFAQSRLRHELEAAQRMAELLKQIDALRAEIERLKAAAKPKEGG